ncbi:MAG: S8 family serine peptidase [Pseudomonadota bacterium]
MSDPIVTMHPLQRALAIAALCALPLASIAADARTKVTSAADLPRTEFALDAAPSLLALDRGVAFDTLRDALEQDVQRVLDQHDIADAGTRRNLLGHLRRIAILEGRFDDALALIGQIRALEDKDAARETAGFIPSAYIEAAKAAGTTDASEQHLQDAFAKALNARLNAMDLSLAQDTLRQVKSSFDVLTPALLRGSLEGSYDLRAAQADMTVDRDFAAQILAVSETALYLPLGTVIAEAIGERLAAAQVSKVDRWSERQVALASSPSLTPVTVGIWDSGTDMSLFQNRWVNPNETRNGRDDDGNGFIDDIHGVAYDTDYLPSTGALRPMPEGDLQSMDSLIGFVKGRFDILAGIDSEDASAYRQAMTSLTAEQVAPFQLQMGRIGLYLHGTATAYTAQMDNPAAVLTYSRFDAKVQATPAPFDEAFAANVVEHLKSTVAHFQRAGVKVANLSWRISTPMIERTLEAAEPDEETRRDRASAIFATMNAAAIEAFQSAPEILFVAGAGNEDENVNFVKSFPAGIDLPNVMTVGAVDVALEPAHFTSYGESIDVYANGKNVPTVAPGGSELLLSGTSLAAPQVTNLAAKLWAMAPEAGVAQIRRLIEGTASEEKDGLKVIDPQGAVEALQARFSQAR